MYKMESKQNYHRKALPLGLQSEEIDTKRGRPASIEGLEGIKCELGKTGCFNVEKGFVSLESLSIQQRETEKQEQRAAEFPDKV